MDIGDQNRSLPLEMHVVAASPESEKNIHVSITPSFFQHSHASSHRARKALMQLRAVVYLTTE